MRMDLTGLLRVDKEYRVVIYTRSGLIDVREVRIEKVYDTIYHTCKIVKYDVANDVYHNYGEVEYAYDDEERALMGAYRFLTGCCGDVRHYHVDINDETDPDVYIDDLDRVIEEVNSMVDRLYKGY